MNMQILKTPQKPKQPASEEIPKDIKEFIEETLANRMPSLMPFAFSNKTLLNMVKGIKRHLSGSTSTCFMYLYSMHRFSEWIKKSPDQIIAECKEPDGVPIPKALVRVQEDFDNFLGELQSQGLTPSSILNYKKAMKSLFYSNGLQIVLPKIRCTVTYRDRAPTPEELQHLIDLAELRGKVIISCLALGGFREGTLARLKYRHIKNDYERGVTPIHVHVEAAITKGKYGDYDTFIGQEAVAYIKAYLEYRQRGSPRGFVPPEKIMDDSPLIRYLHGKGTKPVTVISIYREIHELYRKAGLISQTRGRRYELRPHSVRKFFLTQMLAAGVNSDYANYMMGHKINTYHDIQMKGVEFLRGVYASSGLSIRTKTKFSQIEALKQICRAWGLNPDEVLTREAMSAPHRIYASPTEREGDQVKELSSALKDMMLKELSNGKKHGG
jgi:hypothetical protein